MSRIRRLIPLLTLIAICVVPRFFPLPQMTIEMAPQEFNLQVDPNLQVSYDQMKPVEPQKAEFITLLILFVVTLVLSELLKPKPKIEDAKPAGLGDFKFPTATEGRPVPIIWGTVKQEGPNVVWYGDLRVQPITEKVKTGLFSSKKITKGYRYYLGVQAALCRGGSTPVGNLLRIWVGDAILWTGNVSADGATIPIDLPNFFGGDDQGQGGMQGTFRFHSGSMTQGINAYLGTRQVVGGATPAYRGCCYVVWEGGYLGNSENIKPWAFEVRRIPNGLALGVPSVNSGNDANPMNVIHEILTNTEWGLGQPSTDIDSSDFTTQANTLRTEGNGFSMLLDSKIEAQELLRQIEQQIDGVVYLDRTTGLWKCNLARGGYTLSTKRAIDDSNIISVNNFSRGAWTDTSNNVLIKFNSRALDYKETYAGAQDMANVKTQGNRIVSVEAFYPGVKDPTLANIIAWRYLRTLSYPMARAEIVVDRSLWDHNPGDVVRWTSAELGFTDLPMRITKIDLGKLEDGQITVTLVQDIFVFDVGVFSAPGATNWVPPPQNVVAIPTADSVVMEAPRKFCTLDPEQPGVINRIWAGGRFQNDSASGIDIATRPNAGSYTDSGDINGFLVAGTLSAALNESGTQGSISFNVDPTLDSLTLLQNAMEAAATQEDCGTRLANIVLIDGELFTFKSVGVGGGQLQLSGGYRAQCDTAPTAHVINSKVFILFGGNLTDRVFAPATVVNVKLLPHSITQALPEPSATAINVTMSKRADAPYPPVALRFNNTLYPTGNVDIDSAGNGGPGATLDDRGIATSFVRRDYRNQNEAAAAVDETTLPSDFPTANTTEYAVEVRNDPAGANTLLFTTAYSTGTPSIEISRTLILRNTAGVVPTRMRFTVLTRHTVNGVVLNSLQTSRWDFNIVSALLSGDFNWGVRAFNVSSSAFTAASTGTHTLNIGSAFGTGNVQVSINGGAFATVISAGNTTGTFAATSGDSIVVRHTENSALGLQKFCELTFGGTSIAYVIFTY
jgi:Putative phage tail protein